MAGNAAVVLPRVSPEEIDLDATERSLWQDSWRRFRRHRLARAGLIIYVLVAVLTFIGPFLWREPIDTIDFIAANGGMSSAHPMGTDDLGRDTLARILWGGRVSIAVGIAAMLVSMSTGTLIGALAGFFGGRADVLLSRLIEVFLAIPQLPLLLVVTYLFRPVFTNALGSEFGVFVMIVSVIGGLTWMPTARLVRAGFLTLREREFVEACRVLGVGSTRIIFRHILPNTMSPIIVSATLAVGSAMIAEATLSFLGLGFPPDFPTWGRLLNDAQNYMTLNPLMALFPGIMIFLAVLSINFVGDGLRDALDPRRAP